MFLTELALQMASSKSQATFMVGLAVAFFSVGRLLGSFVFGMGSAKFAPRDVLIAATGSSLDGLHLLTLAVCAVLAIIGNLLYIAAPDMGENYSLLASRVLTGLGTGEFCEAAFV